MAAGRLRIFGRAPDGAPRQTTPTHPLKDLRDFPDFLLTGSDADAPLATNDILEFADAYFTLTP